VKNARRLNDAFEAAGADPRANAFDIAQSIAPVYVLETWKYAFPSSRGLRLLGFAAVTSGAVRFPIISLSPGAARGCWLKKYDVYTTTNAVIAFRPGPNTIAGFAQIGDFQVTAVGPNLPTPLFTSLQALALLGGVQLFQGDAPGTAVPGITVPFASNTNPFRLVSVPEDAIWIPPNATVYLSNIVAATGISLMFELEFEPGPEPQVA
jgi:hypothetical protein